MEVMQVDGSSGSSLSSISPELDKVAPFLIKLFEIVSSPASSATRRCESAVDLDEEPQETKQVQKRHKSKVGSRVKRE